MYMFTFFFKFFKFFKYVKVKVNVKVNLEINNSRYHLKIVKYYIVLPLYVNYNYTQTLYRGNH